MKAQAQYTITELNDIDSVALGGRNLLKVTAYGALNGTFNRGTYHTLTIDATNKYNGNNSLKIVCTVPSVSGTHDVWQKCWAEQVVGKHIMLSLYVKGSVAAKMWFRLAGSTSTVSTTIGSYNVTTGWTRLEVDLGVVTAAGTSGETEIIYGVDTAGTFYINSMMLEYGNKCSEWSPAPEDIDAKIDDTNNKLPNYVLKTDYNSQVTQLSASITAEVTAREELRTEIVGTSYCDENIIDDDDVCDDDSDTVISNLLIDTSAKLELLSNSFSVKLQDNVNQLNSSLTLTTTQFSTEISNLKTNTSTQIEQLSNSIALKVNSGDVSNQLSIETSGINITGNRFTWSATNSSMSANGTLTCNNAILTGKFTNTGSLGTVSITTGYVSVTAGSGSNITEVSSGLLRVSNGTNEIVISPTNIIGNVSINGYTPITSNNISSQSVSYATSAGTASSASNTSSCNTGYLTLSGGTLVAPSGSLWIGQNTVKAETITQTSSERFKKEIADYTENALDIICDSRIRTYRYKNEPSQEEVNAYKELYPSYDYKKHIGVVVEESNTCIIAQCGDGLDLGAMISVAWKAIQELSKNISELEELICQA